MKMSSFIKFGGYEKDILEGDPLFIPLLTETYWGIHISAFEFIIENK